MLTKNRTSGFSLIELVITVTVLAILTLAAVPMVQVSVKRQKEQQLHEALRTMREAIDQFHREALAGSPADLVDAVDRAFLYGRLPAALKAEIVTAVSATHDYNLRVRNAIYLVASSALYQVQH